MKVKICFSAVICILLKIDGNNMEQTRIRESAERATTRKMDIRSYWLEWSWNKADRLTQDRQKWRKCVRHVTDSPSEDANGRDLNIDISSHNQISRRDTGLLFVSVVMRPSYRPHYVSCPSICPSVCYVRARKFVTRKQKNVEKSKLV